jgi:hypothetical protein
VEDNCAVWAHQIKITGRRPFSHCVQSGKLSDYPTDDYATRRGLEQWLYEQYNPPMNRQRPVSPRNPRRDEYKRAAEEYLRQRGIIP